MATPLTGPTADGINRCGYCLTSGSLMWVGQHVACVVCHNVAETCCEGVGKEWEGGGDPVHLEAAVSA